MLVPLHGVIRKVIRKYLLVIYENKSPQNDLIEVKELREVFNQLPSANTLHTDGFYTDWFSRVDELQSSNVIVVGTDMPTRWHSSSFLIHHKQNNNCV